MFIDKREGGSNFFVFIAIFVIKLLMVYFFVNMLNRNEGFILGHISLATGDMNGYTGAMENFIQEGSYYFFNGFENVYAGRLPYYCFPYFIFRQFFEISTSYDLMVLFQLFFETLAIFLMGKLAYFLTKSKLAFWFTIITLTISLQITTSSASILTEGLASSYSVCFFVFFVFWLHNSKNSYLWIASIFLALGSVLRLYLGVLYLIVGLLFIYIAFKRNEEQILSWVSHKVIVFSIPLLALVIPWTVRNYVVLDKFIPLQVDAVAGYEYCESNLAMWWFVGTLGDDYCEWIDDTGGFYFRTSGKDYNYDFPDFVLESIPIDTIRKLKEDFQFVHYNIHHSHEEKYKIQDKIVAEKFLRLREKLQREHWFEANILNRLKLIKRFIIHSGTWFFPFKWSGAPFSLKALKLSQSFLYLFPLIFGFFGLFAVKKIEHRVLIAAVPFVMILVFPILRENCYIGYWIVTYPFFVLSTAILLSKINSSLKKRMNKQ